MFNSQCKDKYCTNFSLNDKSTRTQGGRKEGADGSTELPLAGDVLKNCSNYFQPTMSKDDGFYECQVNTRDKMSLVFKLNVQREFNIFFVCGQRPNDIPSNYLSCCLLDTLLIHIWGVLLGYTSGLNLAVNSLSQLLYNTILLPFQHTFHKFGKYLFLCVIPRCRHF